MKIPIPKEYYKIVDIRYHGNKIRTYQFGSGAKKVLSLPGFPHSGLIYLYFLLNYDLSKITFVTLDLPGWVGYSDNIFANKEYSEDEYIKIIEAVISKYGLHKREFSLIGYSFGSSLAAKLIGLNKYNIKKTVLVSPVLHGKRVKHNRWLLNVVNNLKLYPYLKLHITHRFRLYKARLKLSGMDENILAQYQNLVQNADARVLLESLNNLFTSEYIHLLKDYPTHNLLIASSKDESAYLREQAKYARASLEGENTLFLHGSHEDFIMNPRKDSVVAIMKFLLSD